MLGGLGKAEDWHEVWLSTPEHAAMERQLDDRIRDFAAKPSATLDDSHEYVAPLFEQLRIVTTRASVALYRNTDCIRNKYALHSIVLHVLALQRRAAARLEPRERHVRRDAGVQVRLQGYRAEHRGRFVPNAVFASLTNPLIIGLLVVFCVALVPYSRI